MQFYLIAYAFFAPLVKTTIFKSFYTLISRIKNYGLKIAFIKSFSEYTGIPILKYSIISKNIAIGSAPSKIGLYLLKKKGFKYILNLRFEKQKLNQYINLLKYLIYLSKNLKHLL